MCYLTLLFTRKHCQTVRGRSPDLSIMHAFPNCFSGFDMHNPLWTYSCATARDLHTIPVLISFIKRTSVVANFKERLRLQKYAIIQYLTKFFYKKLSVVSLVKSINGQYSDNHYLKQPFKIKLNDFWSETSGLFDLDPGHDRFHGNAEISALGRSSHGHSHWS